MKSIVVYRIEFLACLLLLGTGLMAQKPAIDLISANHQYRHPEAIIDTAYKVNPSPREEVLKQLPPAKDREQTAKTERTQRRQIGPSLDSLFHKEENKSHAREKSPARFPLIYLRFNPVKFLIFITALN